MTSAVRWRRNRRVAVLLALVAMSASGLVPRTITVAQAQTSSVDGVCGESGHGTNTPGVTFSPEQHRFTLSGGLGPCQLSDSSIHSGTYSGSASGAYGCAAGRGGSGLLTISWNNGKRSAGTFTIGNAGPAAVLPGRFTSGEFAGRRFVLRYVITGGDPSACTSGRGLTDISWQGVFGISAVVI